MLIQLKLNELLKYINNQHSNLRSATQTHYENAMHKAHVLSRLLILVCCSGRNPLNKRQRYQFSIDQSAAQQQDLLGS